MHDDDDVFTDSGINTHQDPAIFDIARPLLPDIAFDDKTTGNWDYFSLSFFKSKESRKGDLYPFMNILEPMSRYHLARLCGSAVPPLVIKHSNISLKLEERGEQQTRTYSLDSVIPTGHRPFIECLKKLAHDEELLTFFEALKQIASRNFAVLLMPDPKASSTVLLLEYVVNRLSNSMKKDEQLQMHSACRSAFHVVSGFQTFKTLYSDQINSPSESPGCLLSYHARL